MKTIFDIVNDLDNAAKIPALRTIIHSSMAKCIGAIRQDIRERASKQRNEELDETRAVLALDQRNERDENERSVEEISRTMGFGETMPALRQANILGAIS